MLNIGIECESIESPHTWGVGRIVKKLLENIAARPELAREFRFFLYFKSRIPDFKFLNNPIFEKRVICRPPWPSSFSLYYYALLPIKLWFERLDMMFFPNYMLSPLFRGKSLVILTEDIYYEIRRSDLRLQYKLAYKIFAEWWAARHATKIMAISETSRREVARLFQIDPNRIAVNQLGIDKNLKTPSLHFNTIVSECKLEKNKNSNQGGGAGRDYILYIGQAFPRRHLRETMLAFEQLVSQTTHYSLLTTHYQLIAVGYDKYNPPIIENLKNEINERLGGEKIIYKEYVSEEELARLYAHAKLLVYVSSKEAFGLPPLEALGYGVPPVVADQEVTREIFGDNAFFVNNPDDPNSIANAITEGLTNETKRQEIKNAREGILAKYTWQKHTDRLLEIIRAQK